MRKESYEKSLNKYSNKETVLNKWIELNKRLNKNKDSIYYSRTILDAQGLVEYVIDNVLKDENGNIPNRDVNGRYYGIIDKLIMTRENDKIIPSNLIKRLKEIKYYRNVVAHSTKTTIDELVDYNKVEEALDVYGEVLSCLGFLEREDIVVGIDKLKAEVLDIIDETVTLDEFIGEGTSGRVFKGYHKRLGIYVAIKEIKHNTVDSDIIENEKKILVSLKHKGIPNIYDVISENRTYYIVMEYVDGMNLEEFIDKIGSPSLKVLIDIGKQLCDIIGYLHEKNIVYNDLKPSNILIDNYNKLSLIDFGISCNVNNRLKLTSTYSGTYVYSSPEQIRGEIGSSGNDIYSLGATLYYISECENPITSEEQRFKKSTDKRIIYIIEKAMDYNKNNRYESIKELKEDLIRVENGKNPSSMKAKDISKNKVIIIAASIIVGIILVSGGSIGIYKTLSTDKNNTNIEVNNKSNKEQESKNSNDSINNDNSNIKDVASNQKTTNEDANNKKQSNVQVSNESASTFNGKLVAKLSNYEVDGKDLVVNVNIVNNYDKEINFWPEGIYMMNENGNKFAMDIHKQLANGGTQFTVVPGESKDFKFYLTDYVESNSLAFKLDKIWCMGPESMKNKIEIKIK
ncbi:serine/threonine-protein kinase [Clostridium saccharobutylicum]|uniref:Serine/threonine-protein kinase PknB n=1 Tax=Clostridium saccharobutylicum DSM 13864 TaxID=1345695 RepID=U5MME3_CLOSA|nr:serine/threonine-protein kinase [Clostridium saccharobutylicum]AGX41944.1 serine/threonine-protein kinase PknB [Clostridium saccharobutylicum DSM 13864]AQR89225.1 serine/threonine-protein kinase PknB [Clostridium saccharobutylicum]AQR99126.1 serine/threonine-protein kinase PknB [Clostridium saccharobutylicum]AQS13114.1 serine/threonine-protein kinase PknB [Clostridium saccharobutylicum]MBA8792229.1 serine/threonine-protein kinase [Clostridium saccharobutylicum]